MLGITREEIAKRLAFDNPWWGTKDWSGSPYAN